MNWQEQIGRLAQRRRGPVVMAGALATLSIVPVAASLLVEPWLAADVGWQQMPFAMALLVAAAAVIPAAIAGGVVGGLVARRRRATGALVALAVSWPIGITMLPVAAARLGANLRLGNVCLDACASTLSDQGPGNGVAGYVMSVAVGALFVVPPIIALVLALAAVRAVRRARPRAAVCLLVLAYGSLHAVGLLYGGWVAYAFLGVGVVAWSSWMTR